MARTRKDQKAEKNKEAMYAGKEGWGVKWTLALLGVLAVVFVALLARGVGWGGHLLEWANLVVRWFHVVIGIAWIGASFYFIWLENNLVRDGIPDNLAGNVHSVHGGGFYYVEKYKVAPPQLPETLHWFQWEAYLTWLSGLGLLIIVYYANAELTLARPGLAIPAYVSILIGLGTLFVGWLVYDRMCRSSLAGHKALFAGVGFALVALLAYTLTFLLSDRAAYMHIGAMLGTLMAANVFFVIIPAHRVMVKAARAASPLDPRYGKNASLRSLHNNYLTLPVIFIMISNHFPSTFGATYNWLVLAGLFLASAGVRHYLNLHERGQQASWILPAASVLVLALALVSAPAARGLGPVESAETVPFTEVQTVVAARCSACHAAQPSQAGFSAPPKGIVFDSPEAIRAQAEAIYTNAVVSDYMPLGNITGMTETERARLGAWYRQGAPGD